MVACDHFLYCVRVYVDLESADSYFFDGFSRFLVYVAEYSNYACLFHVVNAFLDSGVRYSGFFGYLFHVFRAVSDVGDDFPCVSHAEYFELGVDLGLLELHLRFTPVWGVGRGWVLRSIGIAWFLVLCVGIFCIVLMLRVFLLLVLEVFL